MRRTIGIISLATGIALIIAGTAFLLVLNKPAGTAREHFKKGLRAAENGNTMAAISEYSSAIELNPGFIAVYRKRAESYRENGDLPDSADDYRTVIKAGSRNPSDYFQLMSIYIDQGDRTLAIGLIDKVFEIAPDNAALWRLVGELNFKSGLYDEALDAYGKASKLQPTSALPHISRARIYEILGDYIQAKTLLDSAVATEPDNPICLLIRGQYFARRRDYPQAISDYESALVFRPGYYEALIGIERAWFMAGDYKKALEACTVSIDANPERFEAYRDRADVYFALGEKDRAVNDCRAALNRAIRPSDRSRISIKLQKLLY